jgi:hypothetical protein
MNQKRSSLLKQLRYKTLKVYKDLYPRLWMEITTSEKVQKTSNC